LFHSEAPPNVSS